MSLTMFGEWSPSVVLLAGLGLLRAAMRVLFAGRWRVAAWDAFTNGLLEAGRPVCASSGSRRPSHAPGASFGAWT